MLINVKYNMLTLTLITSWLFDDAEVKPKPRHFEALCNLQMYLIDTVFFWFVFFAWAEISYSYTTQQLPSPLECEPPQQLHCYQTISWKAIEWIRQSTVGGPGSYVSDQKVEHKYLQNMSLVF